MMPRGKGFRRSLAAKRRNAERYTLSSFLDLEEVVPPLQKKAVSNSSLQESVDIENSMKSDTKNSQNCHKAFKNVSNSVTSVTANVPKSATSVAKNVPKSVTSVAKNVPKSATSVPMSNKSWSDVTRASVVNNSGYFPQKVIRGSFHQGDARFGLNRNRQCAVNSITAVMTSVLKDVLTWTTEDLNAVLLHGNELYTSMRLQGQIHDRTGLGHISVAEMPRLHTLHNTTFSIKHGESFCGVIGVDLYDESLRDVSMSIEEALQRALLQCDACLLNIKEYICAVIKAGPIFALVDPHSRNGKGLPEPNGRSIIVYCDDIYMLFSHVGNLAFSLNAQGTPFEVTSVKATVIGKTTTMEASSKSGQESSGNVSHATTEKESKCIGHRGKRTRKDKVASLTHVSSTSSEQSKYIKDHDQHTLVNKQTSVCKLDQTCLDSSKKNSQLKTEPELAYVSKLHDNLFMADDVIGGTVDAEFNFQPLMSPDQDANLSMNDDVIIGETVGTELNFQPLMSADQDANSSINDDVIIGETVGTEFSLQPLMSADQDANLSMNDDVIIGETVGTEFSFQPLMSADQDANLSMNDDVIIGETVGRPAERICEAVTSAEQDAHLSIDDDIIFRDTVGTEFSFQPLIQKKIENIRTKYCEDSDYRQKKIENIRTKYCEDSDYRQKKIENIRTKYCEDSVYRQKKIENIYRQKRQNEIL
ncbi:uncharacterized protein LOC109057905 [Cyprinus carpio]|uniref:Uncharacterized protein LOC109057905 n=1 Tax=Cyprinus carpio TaxID=7962 RepID=A0A9R0ASN4_CYPCA|nr:uncharacterized protein LOC109057905 [Cyprinus carpio]